MTQSAEKLVFTAPSTLTPNLTHFCPGCHHGIGIRLVAEVLEEFGCIKDSIGVASVGCSVFAYNYIDGDWLEAAHGRACATATGVKRARPDRVVYTYQGDGDLAAIGLNESIQAANRGEKITVIFVNNTIYGMTGGQMAPTSLAGQKTTTSPLGRNPENEGLPLKMAELMAMLPGVAYSARCALDTVPHVNAARKAIRKAFQVQLDRRGFGFVELLSSCPTNWHMDPLTASRRIAEEMIPYFPLGVYRDLSEKAGV